VLADINKFPLEVQDLEQVEVLTQVFPAERITEARAKRSLKPLDKDTRQKIVALAEVESVTQGRGAWSRAANRKKSVENSLQSWLLGRTRKLDENTFSCFEAAVVAYLSDNGDEPTDITYPFRMPDVIPEPEEVAPPDEIYVEYRRRERETALPELVAISMILEHEWEDLIALAARQLSQR